MALLAFWDFSHMGFNPRFSLSSCKQRSKVVTHILIVFFPRRSSATSFEDQPFGIVLKIVWSGLRPDHIRQRDSSRPLLREQDSINRLLPLMEVRILQLRWRRDFQLFSLRRGFRLGFGDVFSHHCVRKIRRHNRLVASPLVLRKGYESKKP